MPATIPVGCQVDSLYNSYTSLPMVTQYLILCSNLFDSQIDSDEDVCNATVVGRSAVVQLYRSAEVQL